MGSYLAYEAIFIALDPAYLSRHYPAECFVW
jgi:hypothetical protein